MKKTRWTGHNAVHVEGSMIEYPDGKIKEFRSKAEAIKAGKDFAKKQKPGFMVTVDFCGVARDGAWVLQKNGKLLEARYVK